MSRDLHIPLITETTELAALCQELAAGNYVALDTEFMRDRSYWPRLCLLQAANDTAMAVIDPLADGLELDPLVDLLQDESICKVFHAARQDVEISFHLTGEIPHPIFDTQIAAMVCGFGDSVGYDKLVEKITRERIDKASRFTDWSRRPLKDRQLRYAISDVTHLRDVYKWLAAELEREGRASWLDEEMATLTDPATYRLDPDLAWQRLKLRSRNRQYLGVLKEVAAWREHEAQRRNAPRNHVLKDEAIQELAAERPQSLDDLRNLRAVPKGLADGRHGNELLKAVQTGLELPKSAIPSPAVQPMPRKGLGPTIDLLKVLLKHKSEEHDVAAKLIATVSDIEKLAISPDADVPALRGWRRQIFGDDALALRRGELALAAAAGRVKLMRLNPDASD